ncbi:hypothetical protein HYFRA_00012932 [Hymenoscyphus fraxineus]|uniref:UDP-N-acetylglucosamine transferase subunit ALG13 n=1 Tax=Hymenoscyphus fraxineus TaxID=746836 RepID=A0A9N9L742_9HELO|nr:hypothetical protein HYFRA_00012932 [Hymenoscyphus fraxineus]
MRRECFVTIGATAKFEDLVAAAVSEQTLIKLKELGYTHLTVQVGDLEDYFKQIRPQDTKGIIVQHFTFDKDGLAHYMKKCKANPGPDGGSINGFTPSEEGLIICHAGSGTILDGMRFGVPLIVVPNDSLLDNHQDELADELEAQGYVTKGSPKNLAEAIDRATIRSRRSWGHSSSKRGNFAALVDETTPWNLQEDDAKSRYD